MLENTMHALNSIEGYLANKADNGDEVAKGLHKLLKTLLTPRKIVAEVRHELSLAGERQDGESNATTFDKPATDLNESAKTLSAKLTLDVVYTLNGVDPELMIQNLYQACERSIGEGMLTGSTEAEVDQYAMDVIQVQADLNDGSIATN